MGISRTTRSESMGVLIRFRLLLYRIRLQNHDHCSRSRLPGSVQLLGKNLYRLKGSERPWESWEVSLILNTSGFDCSTGSPGDAATITKSSPFGRAALDRQWRKLFHSNSQVISPLYHSPLFNKAYIFPHSVTIFIVSSFDPRKIEGVVFLLQQDHHDEEVRPVVREKHSFRFRRQEILNSELYVSLTERSYLDFLPFRILYKYSTGS